MKQITDNKEEILINGAKKIIETMKVPEALFEFITSFVNEFHTKVTREEKYNQTEDYHSVLMEILFLIYVPWVSKSDDFIEKMAHGVMEFSGSLSPEEHTEMISMMLEFYTDGSIGTPSEDDVRGFKFLLELGFTCQAYEKYPSTSLKPLL